MRACLKDRVFGPEWLKQIAAMKYDEPFTLPPDLELSVQDVKKALAAVTPIKGFPGAIWSPPIEKQQVSPGATMKRAARKAIRYGRGLTVIIAQLGTRTALMPSSSADAFGYLTSVAW